MAERSYPFVDGETTDVEFSEMFRDIVPSSVYSGLQVTGDSSGLNVKVAAGAGAVRGHRYKNTSQVTLAIVAGEGQPRIDTIVLRLEYGAVNDIHLAVKKGTAAASPAAPTLTQTDSGVYEFPLANVAVAAGAVTIAAGNVSDRRAFFRDALRRSVGIVVQSTQPTYEAGLLWGKTP